MTTLGRPRHREVSGFRPGPIIAILVIGLGLVAAPVVFQMFSRAPGGGDMLEDFYPYMEEDLLGRFQSYLDAGDASVAELNAQLPALFNDRLGVGGDAIATDHPPVATFLEQYPEIYADMSDMLVTITENIDNYHAVNALPPFALFPWFFVMPGVMMAGLAAAWLIRRRSSPGLRTALVVLGIGVIAAPFMFSMFSRAPLGGSMINDFKPLMTTERITEIQLYFVTMGGGEGGVRNQVFDRLKDEGGMTDSDLAVALPDTADFIEIWPSMSLEMAPMMAAMSDNIDNFQGIAAMPPFPLFPWFFLIPGVLVAVLAARAGSPQDPDTYEATARPTDD